MIRTIKPRKPETKYRLEHRSYRTPVDRRRAIAQLTKRGYNYFVCYLDSGDAARRTGQRNGLMLGYAEWVPANTVYVD